MIKLPISFTRTLGKAYLWTRRHLPEILTYGGIGATVGGTALMCNATLKADKALTNASEQIEGMDPKSKEAKAIRRNARWQVAKKYALPVAVEGAGIGMILGGHHTLRKENVALAATNVALSAAFAKYRKRVTESIGEDKERAYYYGATVVDKHPETGEEGEFEVVHSDDPVGLYTKFFDVGNPNWSNDPDQNIMFLRHCQDMATQKLRARGYLFLNEVYDMLGIPRTLTGQHAGWVDGSLQGDHYVDFGLYDPDDVHKRMFMNGEEQAILLDFNVDGDIMYILGSDIVRNIKEEV